MRHFLDLSDAGGDAIAAMINDAQDRKAARLGWAKGRPDADAPLAGHVLGMIFEKSSTRTRVSFDIAMRQLGGSALILDSGTSQLGRGESIADTARVLSRMVDAIMIRTDDHEKALEMARHATVPVINGLTDRSHPCQIVADLLTVVEHGKALPGLELAWLGDGNNVLHSILEAAGLMKFNVRVGIPQGYEPETEFVEMARSGGATVTLTQDAQEAVARSQQAGGDGAVSGFAKPHGGGQARCEIPALPAGPRRRRSERRGLRGRAIRRFRRGRKSHSRAKVGPALVFRPYLTRIFRTLPFSIARPIWRA